MRKPEVTEARKKNMRRHEGETLTGNKLKGSLYNSVTTECCTVSITTIRNNFHFISFITIEGKSPCSRAQQWQPALTTKLPH